MKGNILISSAGLSYFLVIEIPIILHVYMTFQSIIYSFLSNKNIARAHSWLQRNLAIDLVGKFCVLAYMI